MKKRRLERLNSNLKEVISEVITKDVKIQVSTNLLQ